MSFVCFVCMSFVCFVSMLAMFSDLRALGNDPWRYSPSKVLTLVFENVSFSGV